MYTHGGAVRAGLLVGWASVFFYSNIEPDGPTGPVQSNDISSTVSSVFFLQRTLELNCYHVRTTREAWRLRRSSCGDRGGEYSSTSSPIFLLAESVRRSRVLALPFPPLPRRRLLDLVFSFVYARDGAMPHFVFDIS